MILIKHTVASELARLSRPLPLTGRLLRPILQGGWRPGAARGGAATIVLRCSAAAEPNRGPTVPDISELLAPGMSHLPLVGALGALSAQVERAQDSRLTCMLIRLLVKKNEVAVSCNWWELVTSDVAPCYRKLLQWEWFITD